MEPFTNPMAYQLQHTLSEFNLNHMSEGCD